MSKALLLTSVNSELKLESVTKQSPSNGQVLIEHIAVAQNPLDVYQKTTGAYINSYPYILGFDVAGIVKEIGPDVTNLKVGDRVLGMTEYFEREKPIDGAFQTHSIHTAAFTTKLPESISFEQAATIPSTMLTAAVGFHAFAELPENYDETTHNNEWFLVWGGASSCGVSAIQLAKLLGFKVVATASPHSFEYVKSYGAEIVLDYNDSEISNKIREVTGGALRYAYEAVSSEGITAKIGKAMSEQGGSIVTVNAGFNEKNVVPDSVKVLPFSCLEMFNPSTKAYAVGKRFFAKLEDLLKDGKIKANKVTIVPNGLLGVEQGIERMKNGKVSGEKLVYLIKDTPNL